MRRSISPEINVTPLVDVCLVLLIIFMVVTPLMDRPADLPETPVPEAWPAEKAKSKITIALGPPVSVTIDDDRTPLTGEALLVLLEALHDNDPRREIAIRADHRLPYGDVRRVVQAVQKAGFEGVGLVTKKRETAP